MKFDVSGEMSALMLFNLRKDSVINTETDFQDMGGWAAPPDIKVKYSQLEN
jgi:hypothetical protein